MHQSSAFIVADMFVQTNRNILGFVEKLSDDVLQWSSGHGQSIAFHLWHVARWTDYFQAALHGMTPVLHQRLGPGVQVWQSSGLAQQWQFDRTELGHSETGMDMVEEAAARLVFPPKESQLAYVRQVFARLEESLPMLDDEQIQALEQWQPMTDGLWEEDTVGAALLIYLTHNSRHFGMMECLFGLQGGSSSITG